MRRRNISTAIHNPLSESRLPKHPARTYYRLSRNPVAGPDLLRAFKTKETNMAWTTPTLVEICIGLEINGYLPAEF